MTSQILALATDVTVKGTHMSTWGFIGSLAAAFVLGALFIGMMTTGGMRSKGSDGKPWWYDVAFPKPDEATLGALKVLADRYALGEIDADEYQLRAKALRDSAPEPVPGKKK